MRASLPLAAPEPKIEPQWPDQPLLVFTGPANGDYMIIDERTYTCHPGKVKAFLEVYERLAKPIQWPIIGEPVGFFTTDTGRLSQVVHMWKYENMADREERRLKVAAAPGWSAYLDAAMPLLVALENRILIPTSFSPLK